MSEERLVEAMRVSSCSYTERKQKDLAVLGLGLKTAILPSANDSL